MSGNVKFYTYEKPKNVQQNQKPSRKNSNVMTIGEIFAFNLKWSTLFYGAIGFLLSMAQIGGELAPLGIAFFGALGAMDKKRMLVQVFPVLGGYWVVNSFSFPAYCGIILLLTLFFTIYPSLKKKSRLLLPIIIFSVSIVVRGLFLIFTEINEYLLVVAFLESILAASFGYIIFYALTALQRFAFADHLKKEEIICIIAFAASIILGLQTITIATVSLGDITIHLFILVAALLGGLGGGAAVGAICGIIPGLVATLSPGTIGVMAFGGLIAGLFNHFGKIGVTIGFLLGNMLLSFYLMNTTVFASSSIAAVVAAIIFFCLPKGLLFRVQDLFRPLFPNGAPVMKSKRRQDKYVSARLMDVGNRLEGLRNIMEINEESEIPREEKNIKGIMKYLSEKVCCECSLKNLCWETDFYQMYRDVIVMFAAVERNGVLTAKDIPKTFTKRCSHYKEMIATVNCLFEMYQRNAYWQQQIQLSRHLAMGQLSNTVHLLTQISENIDSYRDFREALSTKLVPSLRGKGLPIDQIYVGEVGERFFDIDIKAHRCRGGGDCGLVIANTVRELVGKEYFPAEVICGNSKDRDCCHCRFFLAGAGNVLTGSLQIPRDGSNVCGDSYGDFLLSEARQALIISDGMGSGAEARREANLTIDLIRDILDCGFNESFAAATAHYLLMMKQEGEIYATVDLAIVDLCGREVSFVKIGAAPSFLCTANGVKIIKGHSMPFGTGREEEVTIFKEKVHRGDVLVMVSDGIFDTGVDSEDMEAWLVNTIADSRSEEPRIIAERLISGVLAFSGGKPKDDITVTASRIR